MTTLLPLLAWQEAALLCYEEGLAAGHLKQVIYAATGTGKTILYLALGRRRGRVLVLAHRTELLSQPVEKLPLVWPEAVNAHGIVQGDRDEWHAARLVLASVPTACREGRLDRLASQAFDLIVVDEAHHAAAATYRTILDRFPKVPVVGLTATPTRADGQSLAEAGFTAICYKLTIDEAIRFDYLCPFVAQEVPIEGMDLSRIKRKDGDFDRAQLDDEARRCHLAEQAAKAYLERGEGRRALVFTPSVEQAHRVAECLKQAGLAAASVSGETPAEVRRKTLLDLRSGALQVVANCGVYTEGTDVQELACIVMARPTLSKGLYLQMAGRGLRKHPAKRNCLLLDLVGNHGTHGLVMAGSLTGPRTAAEEREENEDLPVLGRPPRDPLAPRPPPEESVEASLVERALAAGRSLTGQAFASRQVAWIECAPDLYAIPLGEEGEIVLTRTLAGWRASEGEVVLVEHADLALVQGYAESVARGRGALALSVKTALWRARPATAGQLGLLGRLRVFFVDGLTQGEALDLLTAAKVRARHRGLVKALFRGEVA